MGNNGTIIGNVTFWGNDMNTGYIEGDLSTTVENFSTENLGAFDPYVHYGLGSVYGIMIFLGENVTFTLANEECWQTDSSGWYFPNGGQRWIFKEYSKNEGVVFGSGVFKDFGINMGDIETSSFFNYSVNQGTVGTCYFYNFSGNGATPENPLIQLNLENIHINIAYVRQHLSRFTLWRDYVSSTYIDVIDCKLPETDILGAGLN